MIKTQGGKMKNILWFKEVGKENVPEVGGKGANLGEMKKAGFPVPDGFIVTADAYFTFLGKTGTREKIQKILQGLDREDSKDLQGRAKKVQEEIVKAKMPEDIVKDIEENYAKLSQGKDIEVAVRSSATAEDLPEASFAGQQVTFLNIQGALNVVRAVQKCWASLFEARAIYYREEKGFDHFQVKIAVPVQQMVPAEKSGVMFSVDPVTNDPSLIAIESGFGLGEAVVSGSITPDRYVVDKNSLSIVSKEVNFQDFMIVKGKKRNEQVKLSSKTTPKANEQKLTDNEIIEVAKIGKKIEEHYNFPQDMEWTVYKGKVYMVQTRPVTTLKTTEAKKEVSSTSPEQAKVILKGAAASLGMASGPVKVIHKASEIDQVLKGNILVTEMTNPDFVPAMKRAVAIVTDKGGRTSHAAIVSRELGIPCVVGTEKATKTLKNEQVITVDGSKGLVYEGAVKIEEEKTATEAVVVGVSAPVTATKIYVNLGEPELAPKISKMNVDGIGLLRAEFIISESIGEHPRAMMEQGRGEEFTQKLANGLEIFASNFYPRPVVYRATDFKTNEYRNLKGGEKYEMQEENPMIGYRGCFRYLKEPDLFNLELEAIKKIRERFNNLYLMIPFVRTAEEFAQVQNLVKQSGLLDDKEFKLWIMVEVPSAYFLIDTYCQMGIDGISIGSNDLTQLILGLDRDNEVIAELFDERHPAVQEALKHIIETCKKYNVTSSICGQAPSVYPEVTEKLVEYGINSISVNPDVIDSTRRLVASVEEKLLLKEMKEVKEELNELREEIEEKEKE